MKKNHKLPLSMVLSGGVLLIIILATLLATLSPYDQRETAAAGYDKYHAVF